MHSARYFGIQKYDDTWKLGGEWNNNLQKMQMWFIEHNTLVKISR